MHTVDASVASVVAIELSRAHEATLQRLVDTLGMEHVEFAERYECDRYDQGGFAGAVRSYEAPRSNVAWCSGLALCGADGSSLHAITAWNTPTVDVPALRTRLGISDGMIDLLIDYLPRLNGGYEACGTDGSFPEPDSRGAFAQAGVRSAYDKAFFTREAREWHAAVSASAGAERVSPDPESSRVAGRRQFGESAGVSYGPLLLSLRLPLTDAGAEVAVRALEHGAGQWLRWMADPARSSWMSNRMQYDRDCQVRQSVYRAEAAAFEGRFGEWGLALAAANAGRHDQAGHNTLGLGLGIVDDSDGRD
ncbi:hypothetical protein T492DRAFT_962231 [Pavlovales sp. CCMP2436]|nr:hypothetical protein T492DRAFT_962231 [Pavlovales sp. CCMP2436]